MKSELNVAVAMIHFGEKYLLGYRNATQHQGEKYEFIGGKIEPYETPQQGLIREVAEEIGCDITNNMAIKMGVIRHDYLERSVALHCFKIAFNQNQFDNLQSEKGSEGQLISWVNKADLLANKYPLPEANTRILNWLTLPDTIFISQSLEKLRDEKDWVKFYTNQLPQNAVFYPRPQTDTMTHFWLIQVLLSHRADIMPLVQWQIYQRFAKDLGVTKLMIHLNHQQLMALEFEDLPKNLHYFASCHDSNSLSRLNNLAQSHTVMGGFLSPVLPTPTHPENDGMGWGRFGELAKISDVPVFALGGVEREDRKKVLKHNGYGIAGIRLIEQY